MELKEKFQELRDLLPADVDLSMVWDENYGSGSWIFRLNRGRFWYVLSEFQVLSAVSLNVLAQGALKAFDRAERRAV